MITSYTDSCEVKSAESKRQTLCAMDDGARRVEMFNPTVTQKIVSESQMMEIEMQDFIYTAKL